MQDNNCSLRAFVDKGVNFYPYANSGRFAVVWENECINTQMKDVIMRKLDVSGTLVNSNYFVVNSNTSNDQIVPSAAGAKIGSADISYTFQNEQTGVIFYKTSNIFNSAVRKGRENKNNKLIYPNPVNDILFVRSEDMSGRFRITDINGKTISEGLLSEYINKINISHLNCGVYIIELIYGNKTEYRKLFVN